MQEEKENCKCPHCGASMEKRPHRVSKGLVQSLVKFKVKVCELDRNSLHLQTDLDFTKSQFTNFQKLRYHGLIAKCYDKETKVRQSGYWLLTRRGNSFLKGEISIPIRVLTFRNRIVEKDENKVSVKHILSNDELPYWDTLEQFKSHEYEDVVDIEGAGSEDVRQLKMF
mgnify:CR=1 FL=1|tara:strand:- start:2355 stop:2861 length:507 start_codon:yes stop_codon:yes gene_type:complete